MTVMVGREEFALCSNRPWISFSREGHSAWKLVILQTEAIVPFLSSRGRLRLQALHSIQVVDVFAYLSVRTGSLNKYKYETLSGYRPTHIFFKEKLLF